MSSRRWVWEQYDTFIQGNSLVRPGSDAGVIRVEGTAKALAFSVDVTPRYCAADPFEGGKQAVAECWRNLTAAGAEPLALTDNLNFGNPERPEIMGELVGAISGIGEAARALAFPVVSGNVSLYNESMGTSIPPTPAIGGVGLIEDASRYATIAFKGEGQVVLLAGAPPPWGSHLGQSVYLREIHGREEGPPPPVDLAGEKRTGDLVRDLIRAGLVTAVHDLSDGGLAIGLAEMAMASGIGAVVDPPPGDCAVASWFGEDQGRYLLAAAPGGLPAVEAAARRAGVSLARLGTTGGRELKLGAAPAISVAKLRQAHEAWFPAFMAG
jgi:phosphoribosylformylglycinamidine synthase